MFVLILFGLSYFLSKSLEKIVTQADAIIMLVTTKRPKRRDRSEWRLNCINISRLPLLRCTDLIGFADGDCRLIAGRGNRHCAEALRSAILFCTARLRGIICLYEGNSHAEDKT